MPTTFITAAIIIPTNVSAAAAAAKTNTTIMSDHTGQAPKGYSYHEMSNKVEKADRSLIYRRSNEPTGEVESLRGRTNIGRMGDRVAGGGAAPSFSDNNASKRPPELEEHFQKRQRKKQKNLGSNASNVAAAVAASSAAAAAALSSVGALKGKSMTSSVVGITEGGRTILDLDDLTGYQPTTPGARAAYESLLVRSIAFYCSRTVIEII